MFSNHYTHSLDGKGRLAIPSAWRKELGLSFTLTRGIDRCLVLFPTPKFESIARSIEEIGLARSDARALSRYLCAEAITGELDGLGRLSLSDTLRRFAEIEDEALVVGVSDRIEIWNPARFAEEDKKIEVEVASLAERIDDALQAAQLRLAA